MKTPKLIVSSLLLLAACQLTALSQGTPSTVAEQLVQLDLYGGEKIDRIEIRDAFDVELVQGENTGVTIQVPEKYQHLMDVKLNNGFLNLSMKELPVDYKEADTVELVKGISISGGGIGSSKPVTIISINGETKYAGRKAIQLKGKNAWVIFKGPADGVRIPVKVEVSELELLDVGNSVKVHTKGNFSGKKCRIDLSHGAQLYGMDFEATDHLTIKTSGAASARNVTVGSAKWLSITSSGSSSVEISADAEEAELEGSGSARIEIDGTAKTAYLFGSGSSRIKANRFVGERVRVRASGSASIRCQATASLNATASGKGKVLYVPTQAEFSFDKGRNSSIAEL